jgi:hypothetical protein
VGVYGLRAGRRAWWGVWWGVTWRKRWVMWGVGDGAAMVEMRAVDGVGWALVQAEARWFVVRA